MLDSKNDKRTFI